MSGASSAATDVIPDSEPALSEQPLRPETPALLVVTKDDEELLMEENAFTPSSSASVAAEDPFSNVSWVANDDGVFLAPANLPPMVRGEMMTFAERRAEHLTRFREEIPALIEATAADPEFAVATLFSQRGECYFAKAAVEAALPGIAYEHQWMPRAAGPSIREYVVEEATKLLRAQAQQGIGPCVDFAFVLDRWTPASVIGSLKIATAFSLETEARGLLEATTRTVLVVDERYPLLDFDVDAIPARPIVASLQRVHEIVRKRIVPLRKRLLPQLQDIAAGRPVTMGDAFVSRLDRPQHGRNAGDGRLCKAQAEQWKVPVPEPGEVSTAAESCGVDSLNTLLEQLQDELCSQCPDGAATLSDYLSPPGRLAKVTSSLLLVIQEGASTVDISDPAQLRRAAEDLPAPSLAQSNSQAFDRLTMYSRLIKVGKLARVALVDGLDTDVVMEIVGTFVILLGMSFFTNLPGLVPSGVADVFHTVARRVGLSKEQALVLDEMRAACDGALLGAICGSRTVVVRGVGQEHHDRRLDWLRGLIHPDRSLFGIPVDSRVPSATAECKQCLNSLFSPDPKAQRLFLDTPFADRLSVWCNAARGINRTFWGGSLLDDSQAYTCLVELLDAEYREP